MATLGNPQNTVAVLQKYNFNFQKKFGQNFLINPSVLEDIISEADVTEDDMVLEIGPGIGTMTQYLCEAARQVIAVEIDTNLIPILQDTLSEYDNVKVINEDILKVDINALANEYNNYAGIQDGTEGEVRFIMIVDGTSQDKNKKEEAIITTETNGIKEDKDNKEN